MPDRENVIKALECCHQINQTECYKCPYSRGNGCTYALMGDVLALLKAQEPAAPVVHGRWTERHVDYASDCAIDEVQTLKCSACSLYHTTPYLYSFTDYKFCPHCGARMDGGDNG